MRKGTYPSICCGVRQAQPDISAKILARLAMLLLVLFGVTLLTFFYTNLSPVDAA